MSNVELLSQVINPHTTVVCTVTAPGAPRNSAVNRFENAQLKAKSYYELAWDNSPSNLPLPGLSTPHPTLVPEALPIRLGNSTGLPQWLSLSPAHNMKPLQECSHSSLMFNTSKLRSQQYASRHLTAPLSPPRTSLTTKMCSHQHMDPTTTPPR